MHNDKALLFQMTFSLSPGHAVGKAVGIQALLHFHLQAEFRLTQLRKEENNLKVELQRSDHSVRLEKYDEEQHIVWCRYLAILWGQASAVQRLCSSPL